MNIKLYTYGMLALTIALGGCAPFTKTVSPSSLPPGANYIYPFASGVVPARLYAAEIQTLGDSISAYNLLPICGNDFELSSTLKGLTSSNSTNYGSISVTAGPQVLAGIAGVPVNPLLTLSAGLGYSNRQTMTFSNVQLIQADADDVTGVISNYLKTQGRGCAALVKAQLGAGRLVIVTQGVLATQQAAVGPATNTNSASCAASGSTASAQGSTSPSTAGGTTAPTAGTTPPASPSAPVSACIGIGWGKGPTISVKASDGTVTTQSISGGVIAIVPSKLTL